jgi:hypothetical protein
MSDNLKIEYIDYIIGGKIRAIRSERHFTGSILVGYNDISDIRIIKELDDGGSIFIQYAYTPVHVKNGDIDYRWPEMESFISIKKSYMREFSLNILDINE